MTTPKHIQILNGALQKRKESNPRYSLRAFASFLGLHPSALSRVLSGKQDLSVPSALQILRKLKLGPEDQEQFIISVGQEKSRQTFATLNEGADAAQLEAALRETEERFLTEIRKNQQLLKTVFTILPLGIAVIDKEGKLILQNPKMTEYLPKGEIPSRTESESARWVAFQSDGTRMDRKNYPASRALRGESILPGVEMLFKDDGTKSFWTKVAAVPMKDESGTVTGAVIMVADIDAQKRYQEALMASEEHLRTVANIIPDLLWNSAPDGSRTWYNDRWMEYTGQSYDEALGTGWVQVIHPEDRDQLSKNFREAVLLRRHFESEHRLRKASGEYRWFMVRAAPVMDSNGEVVQMYGAATDGHDFLMDRSRR